MANNLRKFNTLAEYQSAELVKPAVSLIAATDEVYFDQKDAPVPTFSGLTVYYDITDTSQPTKLFNAGGGSGSGSGSGSGGALPSAMVVDGTTVEVTNTYQFSTTGEHIVNYSFADNAIPQGFLESLPYATNAVLGNSITSIGNKAFWGCILIASINIPNGVISIGDSAFEFCSNFRNIVSNAMTAPTIQSSTFNGVSDNGVLTVPSGSQGYCDWMGQLPSGWTIEGITCGGSGSGA